MSNRVLLVTVDSIRKDHQQYLSRTSDYLDFEDRPVYATAPATYSSFQSIIGGQYPSKSGIRSTVAEEIDDFCMGITTNNFLSADYGFNEGFDYFTSPKSNVTSGWKSQVGMFLGSGTRRHSVAVQLWSQIQKAKSRLPFVSVSRDFRNAQDVITEFKNVQEKHDNWFSWLHFMEPHHPYNAPISDASRARAKSISRKVRSSADNTKDESEIARGLYKDEVRWIDRKLEELWQSLDDDTKVIFCADHGEYLGEDNYWGHGGDLKPTVLQVPFAHKGVESPTGDLISLIDVPTMLLGQEYGQGKMNRSYAYATVENQKAVFSLDGYRNKYGCFNYDGVEIADDVLEEKYNNFEAGESSRMDAGVKEDLEALGYLE